MVVRCYGVDLLTCLPSCCDNFCGYKQLFVAKVSSPALMKMCVWCVEGMDYLHKSFVGPHGHLTSKACVVDSRYSCKITDYGVNWLRDRYSYPDTDEEDADGNSLEVVCLTYCLF